MEEIKALKYQKKLMQERKKKNKKIVYLFTYICIRACKKKKNCYIKRRAKRKELI